MFKIGLAGNTGVGKSLIARSLGAEEAYGNDDGRPLTGDIIREYQWIDGCRILDITFSYAFSETENRIINDKINETNMIICIIHASSRFRIYRDDYALLNIFKKQHNKPFLVVLNKIDLVSEKNIMELIQQLVDFLKSPVLPISAYKLEPTYLN